LPHRRARSLQLSLRRTSSVNSWGEMWYIWSRVVQVHV
jgi:hypothetical protein